MRSQVDGPIPETNQAPAVASSVDDLPNIGTMKNVGTAENPYWVKELNPNTLVRTERGITWNSSTEKVAKIMNSAKSQGISEPIDVFQNNGKTYIIDGHHRVEAAIRIGKNVPVNYLSSPRGYSNLFDLQNAANKAAIGSFKVDGRYLNTLVK